MYYISSIIYSPVVLLYYLLNIYFYIQNKYFYLISIVISAIFCTFAVEDTLYNILYIYNIINV